MMRKVIAIILSLTILLGYVRNISFAEELSYPEFYFQDNIEKDPFVYKEIENSEKFIQHIPTCPASEENDINYILSQPYNENTIELIHKKEKGLRIRLSCLEDWNKMLKDNPDKNKEWYNLVMEKDSVRSELKRLLKLEQNIEYYIQSQKASLIKAIASTVEAIVYTVAFIYLYKKIS